MFSRANGLGAKVSSAMPVAEEVKICPVVVSLLAGIKIWMERWRWIETGRVEEWNEEYEGECEERKCWIQLVNHKVPGVFLIAAVGRSVSCGHERLSLLKLAGLQASQCIEAVRQALPREGRGEKV